MNKKLMKTVIITVVAMTTFFIGCKVETAKVVTGDSVAVVDTNASVVDTAKVDTTAVLDTLTKVK